MGMDWDIDDIDAQLFKTHVSRRKIDGYLNIIQNIILLRGKKVFQNPSNAHSISVLIEKYYW